MSDLSPNSIAERSDTHDLPPLRLGFVRNEPLDTMLKLARLPPPILSYDKSAAGQSNGTLHFSNSAANALRLQTARMQIDLAQLVLAREDAIAASNDQNVIAGLEEVNRYLLHCAHLRLLQEG